MIANCSDRAYNETKLGGVHMHTLYQLIGYAVWYGAFISFVSAILAIPFIWLPNIWGYTVYGVAITKYIIAVLAAIITFTCVSIQIH